LPKSTKTLFTVGMFLAFLVALPLSVYMVTTQVTDLRSHAEVINPRPTDTPTPTLTPTPTGTPNGCGGTCGSNYNCQGGFFCYTGYCRNPFCPAQTNCTCPTVSPTPSSTPSPTSVPSSEPSYLPTPTSTSEPSATPTPFSFTIDQNPTPAPGLPLIVEIALGGAVLSLIFILIGIKKR